MSGQWRAALTHVCGLCVGPMTHINPVPVPKVRLEAIAFRRKLYQCPEPRGVNFLSAVTEMHALWMHISRNKGSRS